MTEEQVHYLSNYGQCALNECLCAQQGLWRGIACEHWQSIGATSPEELIKMMKERYRQSNEVCGND